MGVLAQVVTALAAVVALCKHRVVLHVAKVPPDIHRPIGGDDCIDSMRAERVCLITLNSRGKRQQNVVSTASDEAEMLTIDALAAFKVAASEIQIA
jgi:hypothetical protein